MTAETTALPSTPALVATTYPAPLLAALTLPASTEPPGRVVAQVTGPNRSIGSPYWSRPAAANVVGVPTTSWSNPGVTAIEVSTGAGATRNR